MSINYAQAIYKPDGSIYRYTASLNYILGNDSYYIDTMNIKSIAIDSDYKNTNMPMIFLTVAIDEDLIDIMVKNQETGVIILNVQRAIANSDMPDLYTDFINDKFIYFISDDMNKTYEPDDDAEQKELDNKKYDIVTLGLLSLDHVNKNKKAINGVLNGNVSSILYYLTSHFNVLIEPVKNNINMKNIFLPPMNSISKAIKYLNSLNVFYDTSYRFFIDFDCSYLISSSGKPVKKKGEEISTIFLTLRSESNEASRLQGLIIDEKQAMYSVECDGMDCELADNRVSNKSFSTISATNTSGVKVEGELNNRVSDSVIEKKRLSVRLANDNTGLLDNMIASTDTSSIQLLVQKANIDSSIFTINKEYIIKANELYDTDSYNGNYILTRKRDLFIREDENLTISTMLLFEKVPEAIVNNKAETYTTKK